MSDLPARVAVLEQIAKSTDATLKEMKDDVKGLREVHDRDFRIVFGAIITVALGLAFILAKGFKWF